MEARRFVVRGVVQGVGFRPFVARLADAHQVAGWVLNAPDGVEIHVEGAAGAVAAFARALTSDAPPAARIEAIDSRGDSVRGVGGFHIAKSRRTATPTTRVAPDLPLCDECLAEMHDADDRRFQYPYINCTNCGPRFSILLALPYDRETTTMAAWRMCDACAAEYHDPGDRRFHAEPIACPDCGPRYRLSIGGAGDGAAVMADAARLLRDGKIVAVKGIGGYHLCCDAANREAVRTLRDRKYRKAKPFAVMARDVVTARTIVALTAAAESALVSPARPIVLAPGRVDLPDVAPDTRELGVMLPYAPVHHLLFAAGAPPVVVMTSANRSSEPIAYEEPDALERLHGIADAFLLGDRPIARRVDDSVVRVAGPATLMLRRGRGYAPGVVARLPAVKPILAVGADLKNTVTLVVGGDAIVSQHIGDLEHLSAHASFETIIRDFIAMYGVPWDDVVVAHDLHPQYASTQRARALPASRHVAVQHHRAHIASVLAELGALETGVVGVACDGTGYGDDGTIWGGEFFVGSVSQGLRRVASLRPFPLPGGDAAARWPVQAAAGVLSGLDGLPDLRRPPFGFDARYERAQAIAAAGLRSFTCTSMGRLFDAAAAILGFTRPVEFEGQAAAWVEQLASRETECEPLPFDVSSDVVDFRPTLRALIERRAGGAAAAALSLAFHEAVASALAAMALRLCDEQGVDAVVLSGGTFQNQRLLEGLHGRLRPRVAVWTNREVPPNDGGISLGQAAMAACDAG